MIKINEKSDSNPHNTASKNQSDYAVSSAAILFVVSAVQFLTPFMLSAVGVALPAIGREFSASAVQLGLVETVYIFAFSLFLIPAGRLGDIYGRKRIFTIGILVFTAGTVLISLAFTIESFIVFRFFQGCGGAMISGTSVAILSSVFPPAKRGQAMGIIVGCVYLGLSLGPVLSGFMVTHLGWRWIFYLGVLVELFCLCLTVLKLKGEWADARGERFDFVGTLLYIISLFCLIYGTLNQKEGGIYLVFMASGVLGFLIFLAFEYRCSSPILDVGLVIRNRVFAFSNLATLINYAASFGIGFFFSLYLQVVRGYSPQWAGWILIIQPVFQAALSPFFGRLADRVSPAGLATCRHGLVYPEPGSGFPGSCRNTHARDYGDVGLDGRRIRSFFITQYHHGDGQCSSQKLWYRIQFSGHHADHGDAVQHDHHHPGVQTYHGGPPGECGNTVLFSCQYASLHDDLLLPLRGRSTLFHGPIEERGRGVVSNRDP